MRVRTTQSRGRGLLGRSCTSEEEFDTPTPTDSDVDTPTPSVVFASFATDGVVVSVVE